jgi:hypothetical protein
MNFIKKYYLLLIPIIFLLTFNSDNEVINTGSLDILIIVFCTIFIFELVEKTRSKRVLKWVSNRPSKFAQVLKFSVFFGLPLAAIIIFIIHPEADLLFAILFIAIPLIVIFGWIGLLDWRSCDKDILEQKFNVSL